MSSLLTSSIIGTLAGIIGTGLGGALTFFLKNPSKRFLSTLLSFSAGLMMAVVCFDLLPNSFVIGSLTYGLIGTVFGIIVIMLCQTIITRLSSRDLRKRGGFFNYVKTGILMAVGIALHNFPEGLAIGSGFTALPSYGIGLSLIIAFHDIPEGIAMATPLRMAGVKKYKVLTATIIAGIPTGIGAFIGYLLGEISPIFISICLGFAGGAMLYIIAGELIPEYRDLHKGRISSVGFAVGVLVGIIITQLLG